MQARFHIRDLSYLEHHATKRIDIRICRMTLSAIHDLWSAPSDGESTWWRRYLFCFASNIRETKIKQQDFAVAIHKDVILEIRILSSAFRKNWWEWGLTPLRSPWMIELLCTCRNRSLSWHTSKTLMYAYGTATLWQLETSCWMALRTSKSK